MITRVSEKELILPALYCIKNYDHINTTKLIFLLEEMFSPTGEDAAILAGRKDTKFSQKVRNLMGSHYETNGMGFYTYKTSKGFFMLTFAGEELLSANAENINIVINSSIDYANKSHVAHAVSLYSHSKKKVFVYDENEIISEGELQVRKAIRKTRSKKLRDAAIDRYSLSNGHIKCSVCGFDFVDFYGEIGKGYIDIHHEEPIFQLPAEGSEVFLQKAVEKVKPVCPNCHRMLHQRKNNPLTIEELKEMMKSNCNIAK